MEKEVAGKAGQDHTDGQGGRARVRHTRGHKLSMIRTKALVDTLAYTVIKENIQALCYKLGEVDLKTLIYALIDRLPVDEKKVGNMSAKVEFKAVLDTLGARETEV